MIIRNLHHNTIRVCFISLRAYPLFRPEVEAIFGGAEVDLYLLATELAKDEAFSVQFVVADYGQAPTETIEQVKLYKSLNVGKNLFLGGRKIWRALQQADAQIYMSEACSLGTVLHAYFCRKHDRKFIYRTAAARECNGIYFQNHPLRAKAVLWAFRQADTFITQNEVDAENLQRTTGLSSRVIRNVTRLPERIPNKEDIILWVARSSTGKHPERLFQLARDLPEKHFTMICPQVGEGSHYEELVRQAESVPNVQFHRRVPFQEVGAYFERARMFVCTSDAEGFPNTYVQSCQNATPIVSFKVNPDTFLNRYQCGFCAEGNWPAFVNAVRTAMDTDAGATWGANARHYVEDTHDITKIIEEYKTIFRQLV
jgi:glycosyltransferase involved in cell wall biosynthesis